MPGQNRSSSQVAVVLGPYPSRNLTAPASAFRTGLLVEGSGVGERALALAAGGSVPQVHVVAIQDWRTPLALTFK